MEELAEVKKILEKLTEAEEEAHSEKELFEFKKRVIIQQFWINKITEILDIIGTLKQVVHEKQAMYRIKCALHGCIDYHRNIETPCTGRLDYIEAHIEYGKKYLPQ